MAIDEDFGPCSDRPSPVVAWDRGDPSVGPGDDPEEQLISEFDELIGTLVFLYAISTPY
jgi:hypothetical protein